MKDLTAREVANLKEPGTERASRNPYVQMEAGAGGINKSWLFRYMRDGVPHWHGLGSLDLVTLAEARDKALACRKMLLDGIDPIEAHRSERMKARLEAARSLTFKECAEKYIAAHEPSWRNEKHRA
jgi:hypothetical protein